MNLTSWLDFLLLIIPTVLGSLLGGVIGFQVFMFKSITALKENLNEVKLQIAKEHLTKQEFQDMLEKLEQRLNIQLELIRRESRK